jgi:hypothetical protein
MQYDAKYPDETPDEIALDRQKQPSYSPIHGKQYLINIIAPSMMRSRDEGHFIRRRS